MNNYLEITSSSGIYFLINCKNNRFYIGSTKNFIKRKNSHFSTLRKMKHSNKDLQEDFNLFGEDKFSFKVIEYCEVDLLEKREQHWIDFYWNSNMLYNILKCAYSPRGEFHPLYGKLHSNESKEKIRIARGKQIIKHSYETRCKMSKSSPYKGKHLSIETRNKISETRKKAKYAPWSKKFD